MQKIWKWLQEYCAQISSDQCEISKINTIFNIINGYPKHKLNFYCAAIKMLIYNAKFTRKSVITMESIASYFQRSQSNEKAQMECPNL